MTAMNRLISAVWALFALLTVSGAHAQDADLWRLVAQSDAIVVGQLGHIDAPLPDQSYVTTEVLAPLWLKGAEASSLTLNWYSEARPYAPSPEALLGLRGDQVIVFAVSADGKYYFAGHSPSAIRSAHRGTIARIGSEIARQRDLLDHWQDDPDVPHHDQVAGLIAAIADLDPASPTAERDQQALFDALLALGPAAVPAIIMQLDDDRRLAVSAISLRNNSPDAFEAYRHYGPKTIGDALAAILNQLTGESFGSTYNGGNAAERLRTLAGWRVYLASVGHATSVALP